MAKYTGPKCRYCRADQTQLYLKGARCATHCPLRKDSAAKKSGLPGRDPKMKPRKATDYGMQLREKQKLKRMYGMQEKPFHLIYEKAMKMSGITGENIINLLERRLDNIVFRLHFASTRSQAAQIVCHGHVFVNGSRVDVPSYTVNVGDEISIRPQSQKITLFRDNLAQYAKKENNCMAWLSLDTDAMSGKLNSMPVKSDIQDLLKINEQLIVELYSK